MLNKTLNQIYPIVKQSRETQMKCNQQLKHAELNLDIITLLILIGML